MEVLGGYESSVAYIVAKYNVFFRVSPGHCFSTCAMNPISQKNDIGFNRSPVGKVCGRARISAGRRLRDGCTVFVEVGIVRVNVVYNSVKED